MSREASATLDSGSSPSAPRICKKLVLKGHASSTQAAYTLFLKVQLPLSERAQTYTLLSDPNTQLQDAVVHRLDSSGAAPALSTSAATAASSLGIPLSIDQGLNDSLIDFEPGSRKASRGAVVHNDHSDMPLVAGSHDGVVTLRSPVRLSPASKRNVADQHSSSSYMVTLHLLTVPSARPPFAPLSLRLAVPVCLNNFMRFTVDESIDIAFRRSGIDVEVDPPVLPVSEDRKSLRRRTSTGSSHRAPSTVSYSEDEADVTLPGSTSVDGSDMAQDDTAIVGPFQACDALVIRIASQQAGDLVLPGSPLSSLPNALRTKHAHSSIAYQPRTSKLTTVTSAAGSNLGVESSSEINFEATIQLDDPFFPGLDREVLLYLQFQSSVSLVKWRPIAVDASRGILSWSFGPTKSALSSPIRESNGTTATAEGILSKSPTFEIGDLVVLPEPNQQAGDEEEQDLLKTAPPKGLDDADFDFSLDSTAAVTTKQRRFSLQSSASNRPSLSLPPSEHSATGSASNMLMIAFNLLPVLQSTEPIIVTVHGVLTLQSTAADALQSQDMERLPKGLCAPAALAHDFDKPIITVTAESPLPEALQAQSSLHHSEKTLEGAHETKQHVQEKPEATMQSRHPPHSGEPDEILRQALAIIAAHNASLSEPKYRLVPSSDKTSRSPLRTQERVSGNDWILRTSHLLWTLFLTAIILMLFNAGQNANRELSAKIDQLSRIVEASMQSNPTNVAASVPVSEPVRVSTPLDESVSPDLVADAIGTPDELLENAASLFSDKAVAEDTEVLPQDTDEGGRLTHHVSHWLHDLLRVPVLFLQRLLSVLTGF